jgi:hypothetical protein
MTVHGEHPHAHAGVRQEEDRISTPLIVAVGVVSLVIFILSAAVVMVFFKNRMDSAALPPVPQEVGRSKIGMVEQQLFEVAQRGARDRAGRLERLGSYGWVDRGAGIAHIPIGDAMDLVAKGVRAKGGEQQERRNIGGQP